MALQAQSQSVVRISVLPQLNATGHSSPGDSDPTRQHLLKDSHWPASISHNPSVG